MHDCLCRSEEGEGCGDYLVTRANAQGAQANDQGVGAGVKAYCVLDTQITCDLLLERRHFRSEHVLTAAQNAQHSFFQFRPQLFNLILEVEHRYWSTVAVLHMASTTRAVNAFRQFAAA